MDCLARIDWSFVKATPSCSYETNHSVKSLDFQGVSHVSELSRMTTLRPCLISLD